MRVGGVWQWKRLVVLNGFAPGVMRRTARFGDGFIPTYTPVEGYQEAQRAIVGHAEAKGRDSDCIEWGVMLWTYIGDEKDARQQGIEAMKQRMSVAEIAAQRGDPDPINALFEVVMANGSFPGGRSEYPNPRRSGITRRRSISWVARRS